MNSTDPKRFDRPDRNLAKPMAPRHVIVTEDKRGGLDLSKDGSQHRRYTAFYDDLQN